MKLIILNDTEPIGLAKEICTMYTAVATALRLTPPCQAVANPGVALGG